MKENNQFFLTLEQWYKNNPMLVKIVVGVLVALILFFAWKTLTKPKPRSYNDLIPMMEDARKFDKEATDITHAYDGLEKQMSAAQYNALTYKPYEAAAVIQQEQLDRVGELNSEVIKRGGITTLHDLERTRTNQTNTDTALQAKIKEREAYK